MKCVRLVDVEQIEKVKRTLLKSKFSRTYIAQRILGGKLEEIFPKLKVGDIISDKAILSSSINTPNVPNSVKVEIEIPQGSKGRATTDISTDPDELELLLASGTQFKVLEMPTSTSPLRVRVSGVHESDGDILRLKELKKEAERKKKVAPTKDEQIEEAKNAGWKALYALGDKRKKSPLVEEIEKIKSQGVSLAVAEKQISKWTETAVSKKLSKEKLKSVATKGAVEEAKRILAQVYAKAEVKSKKVAEQTKQKVKESNKDAALPVYRSEDFEFVPKRKSKEEVENAKADGLTTTTLEDYIGSEYTEVNGYLRGLVSSFDDFQITENNNKSIKILTNFLDKSRVKKNVVVSRQVNYSYEGEYEDILSIAAFTQFKSLKKGDTFVDSGFVSTSFAKYPKTSPHPFTLNIEIEVPEGTKAASLEPFSNYADEFELLLQRGTKFEVIQEATDSLPLRLRVVSQDPIESYALVSAQNSGQNFVDSIFDINLGIEKFKDIEESLREKVTSIVSSSPNIKEMEDTIYKKIFVPLFDKNKVGDVPEKGITKKQLEINFEESARKRIRLYLEQWQEQKKIIGGEVPIIAARNKDIALKRQKFEEKLKKEKEEAEAQRAKEREELIKRFETESKGFEPLLPWLETDNVKFSVERLEEIKKALGQTVTPDGAVKKIIKEMKDENLEYINSFLRGESDFFSFPSADHSKIKELGNFLSSTKVKTRKNMLVTQSIKFLGENATLKNILKGKDLGDKIENFAFSSVNLNKKKSLDQEVDVEIEIPSESRGWIINDKFVTTPTSFTIVRLPTSTSPMRIRMDRGEFDSDYYLEKSAEMFGVKVADDFLQKPGVNKEIGEIFEKHNTDKHVYSPGNVAGVVSEYLTIKFSKKFDGFEPSTKFNFTYGIAERIQKELEKFPKEAEFKKFVSKEIKEVPTPAVKKKERIVKKAERAKQPEEKIVPVYASEDFEFVPKSKGGEHIAGKGEVTKETKDSVDEYAGQMYSAINSYLRGAEVSWRNDIVNHIENLTILANSRTTTKNIIVSRQINYDYDEEYSNYDISSYAKFRYMKKGSVFTDSGFVSTSFAKSVKKDPHPFVLRVEIEVPEGTKGVSLKGFKGSYADEYEFLLQRGTTFEVIEEATENKPLRLRVVSQDPVENFRISASSNTATNYVEQIFDTNLELPTLDVTSKSRARIVELSTSTTKIDELEDKIYKEVFAPLFFRSNLKNSATKNVSEKDLEKAFESAARNKIRFYLDKWTHQKKFIGEDFSIIIAEKAEIKAKKKKFDEEIEKERQAAEKKKLKESEQYKPIFPWLEDAPPTPSSDQIQQLKKSLGQGIKFSKKTAQVVKEQTPDFVAINAYLKGEIVDITPEQHKILSEIWEQGKERETKGVLLVTKDFSLEGLTIKDFFPEIKAGSFVANPGFTFSDLRVGKKLNPETTVEIEIPKRTGGFYNGEYGFVISPRTEFSIIKPPTATTPMRVRVTGGFAFDDYQGLASYNFGQKWIKDKLQTPEIHKELAKVFEEAEFDKLDAGDFAAERFLTKYKKDFDGVSNLENVKDGIQEFLWHSYLDELPETSINLAKFVDEKIKGLKAKSAAASVADKVKPLSTQQIIAEKGEKVKKKIKDDTPEGKTKSEKLAEKVEAESKTPQTFFQSKILDNLDDDITKITKKEIAGLAKEIDQPAISKEFTRLLQRYAVSQFRPTNAILRGVGEVDSIITFAQWKEAIELATELSKTRTTKSFVVRREIDVGTIEEIYGKLEVGKVITDKGLLSTTINLKIEPNKRMMDIEVPKGIPGRFIAEITRHREELELLLGAGTRMEAIKVRTPNSPVRLKVIGTEDLDKIKLNSLNQLAKGVITNPKNEKLLLDDFEYLISEGAKTKLTHKQIAEQISWEVVNRTDLVKKVKKVLVDFDEEVIVEALKNSVEGAVIKRLVTKENNPTKNLEKAADSPLAPAQAAQDAVEKAGPGKWKFFSSPTLEVELPSKKKDAAELEKAAASGTLTKEQAAVLFRKDVEVKKLIEELDYPPLTDEQANLLRAYTEPEEFTTMNKLLRGQIVKVDSKMWGKVNKILETLLQFKTKHNYKVTRVLGRNTAERWGRMKVGETLNVKGFTSTSLDGRKWDDVATKRLVRIEIPEGFPGRPVMDISDVPTETEILLPPNVTVKKMTKGTDTEPAVFRVVGLSEVDDIRAQAIRNYANTKVSETKQITKLKNLIKKGNSLSKIKDTIVAELLTEKFVKETADVVSGLSKKRVKKLLEEGLQAGIAREVAESVELRLLQKAGGKEVSESFRDAIKFEFLKLSPGEVITDDMVAKVQQHFLGKQKVVPKNAEEAIKFYTGTSYADINDFLRGNINEVCKLS